MKISPEIVIRLEDRLQKLKKAFGYRGVSVRNATELAEQILNKSLTKAENKEIAAKNNKGSNHGISWKVFRKQFFPEIYKESKGICEYCNQKVPARLATLDHILSPSRGGCNIKSNICVACDWCNVDKGILNKEEYFYKQMVNKSKGITPPIP